VTVTPIIRRQNAVPFEPYKILLADGRDLLVKHPDFASVSEEEESITTFDENGGVEIVDLALVVSLQYREPNKTI
jgi:hypothetical protein